MALRNLSTADLRREIDRRERGATKIAARRDKLAKQLAALDAELADLGVDGAPKRRGRPPGSKNKRRGRKPGRKPSRKATGRRGARTRAKNKMSLADAVAKCVPAGKTVAPADVLTAVRKIYKSSSKHLGMMVANTLAKHPEFKRLGRGQYKRVGGKRGTSANGTAAKQRKPRNASRRAKPKTKAKPKTTSRTRRKTSRRPTPASRTRTTPKSKTRKSPKARTTPKPTTTPAVATASPAAAA